MVNYSVGPFSEEQAQVILTVVTSVFALPSIFYSYSKQNFFQFIIYLATMVTSIIYHSAEVYRATIWGMNDGSWHRLDNVFAILSFQSLFLNFAGFKRHAANDLVRWMCLVLTLWCQERGPWKVQFTVIPVVFAAVIMVLHWLISGRLPSVHQKPLTYAGGLVFVGIFFFIRGLDDRNDWLRLNHHIWHLFVGLAGYYFLKAKKDDEITADFKKIV